MGSDMSAEDLTFWAKVIGGCSAGVGLIAATLKGMFVTKREFGKVCDDMSCRLEKMCGERRAACVAELDTKLDSTNSRLADIHQQLVEGDKHFKNVERYIVALASKANIRPEDIAKI